MDKIDPPVELVNPDSRASAHFILNLGLDGPCNYDDVSSLWSQSLLYRNPNYTILKSKFDFIEIQISLN